MKKTAPAPMDQEARDVMYALTGQVQIGDLLGRAIGRNGKPLEDTAWIVIKHSPKFVTVVPTWALNKSSQDMLTRRLSVRTIAKREYVKDPYGYHDPMRRVG